jgi:hypothetical protein
MLDINCQIQHLVKFFNREIQGTHAMSHPDLHVVKVKFCHRAVFVIPYGNPEKGLKSVFLFSRNYLTRKPEQAQPLFFERAGHPFFLCFLLRLVYNLNVDAGL